MKVLTVSYDSFDKVLAVSNDPAKLEAFRVQHANLAERSRLLKLEYWECVRAHPLTRGNSPASDNSLETLEVCWKIQEDLEKKNPGVFLDFHHGDAQYSIHEVPEL